MRWLSLTVGQLIEQLRSPSLMVKKCELSKATTRRCFTKINKKAIEAARGEWILQLDADEELSEGLKKEIKMVVENSISLRGLNSPARGGLKHPVVSLIRIFPLLRITFLAKTFF